MRRTNKGSLFTRSAVISTRSHSLCGTPRSIHRSSNLFSTVTSTAQKIAPKTNSHRKTLALLKPTTTSHHISIRSSASATPTTAAPASGHKHMDDGSQYDLTFDDIIQSRMEDSTGSLARDLMALERTYLAWVRTSFVIFGLGVALSEYKKYMIGRSKEEHERLERKTRWKEKNHILQEEMQHLHLQSQPVAPPAILPSPPTTVVAASGTLTAQPHPNSWLHLLEGYSSFIVILSGQVLLVTSTIRYFRTAKAIKLGKYPTNKLGVLLMSSLTAAVSLMALWLISANEHDEHHKSPPAAAHQRVLPKPALPQQA